jgi:hypothetical protein
MRHYPGLAASPPGPYKLEVERAGNGLSLPVCCVDGGLLAKRRRAAYGDTVGPGGSPMSPRMRPRNDKFFTGILVCVPSLLRPLVCRELIAHDRRIASPDGTLTSNT